MVLLEHIESKKRINGDNMVVLNRIIPEKWNIYLN